MSAVIEDYITWCLARPGESRSVESAGARMHYLEWPGPSQAPTVMLLHGFIGHAHWWDFVAPALAEDYRVVAVDLSGMGDSGHRPDYPLEMRAQELGGVIRQLCSEPIILIGHSFGGRCAILTAQAHAELVRQLIVIDSRVSFPEPGRQRVFGGNTAIGKKRYADFAHAKSRFRLMPEEPGVHPTILDHIAGHSLKQDGDAWVWKFDGAVLERGPKPEISDARALPLLTMPMDYVCGESSLVVNREHALQVVATTPQARGPIVIPRAHHHLPIGQPVALTSVLRALLAVRR